MPQTYTVDQGDFIASIADECGFSDYLTLWNHPANSNLKALRKNPNVLFPTDEVSIPDHCTKDEPRCTNQRHCFQVNRNKLQLRMVLEDMYEKPIANAQCELMIDMQGQTVTSSSSGKVEIDISPKASEALLTIQSESTPFTGKQFSVKIGYLDPVDEVSGQQARLNNLGYLAAKEINGKADSLFRSAVEEFQCDHGLGVDGICGPATKAKLTTVHGC